MEVCARQSGAYVPPTHKTFAATRAFTQRTTSASTPDRTPDDQRNARGACEADSSTTVREPQARQAGGGFISAPSLHAREAGDRFASSDSRCWVRSDSAAWSCRSPGNNTTYMLLLPSGSALFQRPYAVVL